MNGSIIVRLIWWTKSDKIRRNTLARICTAYCLIFWASLTCLIRSDPWLISRTFYLHTPILISIDFFHGLTFNTFLCFSIKVCITLKFTNPTSSNSSLISQFSFTFLALTGRKVNELSLFAVDTLLLAHVEHSLGTVETGFREIDCEGSFNGAWGQVELSGSFEEFEFVLVLGGRTIEPVFGLKVWLVKMLIKINLTGGFFILNSGPFHRAICLIQSMINDSGIIVLFF